MKASTTILSGIILTALGITLTMAPEIFSFSLDTATRSLDSSVKPNTLTNVITGNTGILVGISLTLIGMSYIFILSMISYSASLDMKIINFSSIFITTYISVNFFVRDFIEYNATWLLIIPIIASVIIIMAAPFASLLFPRFFSDRRDFEDAKISADKLYSYAASHNTKLRQMQKKIEDLENQEEILKNLMGEEKIDSVFKIIDRRKRNGRITTFILGISTGVISTFISNFIFIN